MDNEPTTEETGGVPERTMMGSTQDWIQEVRQRFSNLRDDSSRRTALALMDELADLVSHQAMADVAVRAGSQPQAPNSAEIRRQALLDATKIIKPIRQDEHDGSPTNTGINIGVNRSIDALIWAAAALHPDVLASSAPAQPEAKCVKHCEHDPRWMVEGRCRFFKGRYSYPDVKGECGHVCEFAPQVDWQVVSWSYEDATITDGTTKITVKDSAYQRPLDQRDRPRRLAVDIAAALNRFAPQAAESAAMRAAKRIREACEESAGMYVPDENSIAAIITEELAKERQ